MDDNLSHISISDLKEMRENAKDMLAFRTKSIAHLPPHRIEPEILLHIKKLKEEIKEINETLKYREDDPPPPINTKNKCEVELKSQLFSSPMPPITEKTDEKAPVTPVKDTSKKVGDTAVKPISKMKKIIPPLSIFLVIVAGLIVSFFLYMQYLEERGKTTFKPKYPYLEVVNRKQDPKVEFNRIEHKVSLTSKISMASVFWMKFRNDNIQWDEYDKICLKVDYDQGTHFDQSAMLKLQLNEITLSPLKGRINRLGINNEELFLFESRGSFYYQLRQSDLDEKNDVTIILNKGKWVNLCIELTLIKKNQNNQEVSNEI